MDDDLATITLRECMAAVQSGMNAIMGIDRGRRGDLSPITAGILYLSYFHRTRMGDVAKTFGVSRSTATGYIDNLERLGYVRREQGEDDRRDIFIIPAPGGEQWIQETEKRVFSLLNDWLERLPPSERLQFIGYFSKFTGYNGSEGSREAISGIVMGHLQYTDSSEENGDDLPGSADAKIRRENAWDTGIWLEE